MVKPGYKQSEVGIIPEDWGVTTLRAAFPKLEAGVSVNSDNMTSSQYHVLKTSAVHNGIFDPAEIKPVIKADYSRLKCPLVQGSIIISRMNTPTLVGECGYVKNAQQMCTCQIDYGRYKTRRIQRIILSGLIICLTQNNIETLFSATATWEQATA